MRQVVRSFQRCRQQNDGRQQVSTVLWALMAVAGLAGNVRLAGVSTENTTE
jgi:hypothetical protein